MKSNQKPPLLVIAGPTASGKTALSIALAKKNNGEVISADSMQIYEGLDIATAKPTKEEMRDIPHHLLSYVKRNTAYSVAEYVESARKIIGEIHERKKLPILAGGTGLYLSSIMDHIQFQDEESSELREKLEKIYASEGIMPLYEQLKERDPAAAEQIHVHNEKRVIRALELVLQSGKTMEERNQESRAIPVPYQILCIGLDYADRQHLYDRINLRVDLMFQQGMLEEVAEVYQSCREEPLTAGAAIGYKELIPYFEGRETLEHCKEAIKQESRRYAKRQLTWLRKVSHIQWITVENSDTNDEIFEKAQELVEISEIL